MQTKNMIEAQAEITTILSLSKGDVYKRLEESTYSSPSLRFGVVTSVMHNGESAAFTALEYKRSYPSVEIELKVFSGDADLKLFAATEEEFRAEAGDLIGAASSM